MMKRASSEQRQSTACAIKMNELDANEKYAELSDALPHHASNPGTIQSGDVMLYALGSRNVTVSFEM
jgi:hypothetical protein